jgi:Protein of unknown function (DUF2652)
MELKPVALVLAQINGYETLTLNELETQHAEQHTSQMLEVLVDFLQPPLTLSKLEGDGLLLYAPLEVEESASVAAVAQQISGLFQVFAGTAQTLTDQRTCRCAACLNLQLLHFTLVAHAGPVVFKQIRQFHELAGENMIRLYRLLRFAQASTNNLILSDDFHRLAPNWTTQSAQPRTVDVPGLSSMPVWAYDFVG